MDKNIVCPIGSEILSNDDLYKITGKMPGRYQITWLTKNGWKFYLNATGSPVIGTWYARMKLASIEPSELLTAGLTDPATLLQDDQLRDINN